MPAGPQVRFESGKKRGGVLKYANTHAAPAHFDLTQSGTGGNIRPQSLMYNGLLRYSPFDGGKSIMADLAHKWVVSDDGLSVIFSLREGVKFHDGALLTSEDVVATYERMVFPPEGIVSVRQNLYETVTEVRALDPLTVEFVTSGPSGLLIPAIALDWSIITRKQSLDDHNQDLRRVRDYPGTGPYSFVEYLTDEKWTVERHEDYFIEGLPYLDGMEQFHARGPLVGSLLLSGIADYGFNIPPDADEDILKKGLTLAVYPTPVITGFWMNTDKSPFNDVRVRRAVDLVIDRHELLEVIGEIARGIVGRWVLPGSEYSLSTEDLLKVPSLRPDKTEAIKEAKQLMKDAGFENGFGRSIDFVQRDHPTHILLAQGAQEMMKRHLGIESTIRPVHVGVWFEDVRRGDFDFTVGAIGSALGDPAMYLVDWYSSSGKQNFSRWKNQEFDAIMANLVKELNPERRAEQVEQARELMEQDVPVIEALWNVSSHAWYPYVKDVPSRDQAGNYNVWRWDTVWLDR